MSGAEWWVGRSGLGGSGAARQVAKGLAMLSQRWRSSRSRRCARSRPRTRANRARQARERMPGKCMHARSDLQHAGARAQEVFKLMGYASWVDLSHIEIKEKSAPFRDAIKETWARLKRSQPELQSAAKPFVKVCACACVCMACAGACVWHACVRVHAAFMVVADGGWRMADGR